MIVLKKGTLRPSRYLLELDRSSITEFNLEELLREDFMKKMMLQFIAPIIALMSMGVSADCTKLVGAYLCPKEAASPMMLGSQDISLSYKSLLRGVVFKAGEADLFYELNAWNPAISSNGEIDYNLEVKAVCDDKNVLTLSHRVSEGEGDLKIEIIQDWTLTAKSDGVQVQTFVDGSEFGTFDCKKK